MEFIPSMEMKIELLPEQEEWLSTKEVIRTVCQKEPTVMAFDIFEQGELIGFVLVHRFEESGYFLWDYAIDRRWQNKGLGTRALREFMALLQREHGMKKMTTTYIWGNDIARRMYEKAGFTETDVVDEPDAHEVNMIWQCEGEPTADTGE